jgi:hypothetical protein
MRIGEKMEVGGPEDKKPKGPTWAGTVSFQDSHRWIGPLAVAVPAAHVRVAVYRATLKAKARLPKGKRVLGVVVKLERQAP